MTTQHLYQDPSQSIDARTDDLLGRMTLEEKIAQMVQLPANRDDIEDWVRDHAIGSCLHCLGDKTQTLQRLASEETRLGIPLLFGIDAIHGHAFWPGAAVFPTQLALSCSWNPDLLEEVGRITAKDVRATGIHWTFSPVLCITRDLRWGRVDETFGEDPWLIGILACALIRGYQGNEIGAPDRILACAKHFAGYSETHGGRDATEADLSRRKLASTFLPPFEMAAKAGCATFMTAYQAIDGVPCTASRWLLTELLKEQWGWDGIVVTDWNNFGHMHDLQKTCATMEEAVEAGVRAGNDMSMTNAAFPEAANNAVEQGRVDAALIDDAARRILRMKFRLGLFDQNRYSPQDKVAEVVGRPEDFDHAFECACQSIVLLKNDSGLLPLAEGLKHIAVLGPNADDPNAQLGDWSIGSNQAGLHTGNHARTEITTVLDGVRRHAPADCEVTHARGCDTIDPDPGGIPEAARLAAAAELAVVVVGDDLPYTGEGHDRCDLDLSGAQQQLLEAVAATGTPMVVVLVNSKPLSIPWVKEHAGAIVEAFNPGMKGGDAIAAILFGDRNPCGKLTVSFPHHVGQLPVYYNQLPGWHGGKYVDIPPHPDKDPTNPDVDALFEFGFGLSYTTYAYSGLAVEQAELRPGDPLVATVNVANTGSVAGTEIVQLYINDVYTSVTTPVKELKAFERVALAPGETKTVRFELPHDRLAIVNAAAERVVEPGAFEVFVGPSSRRDTQLCAEFTVVAS